MPPGGREKKRVVWQDKGGERIKGSVGGKKPDGSAVTNRFLADDDQVAFWVGQAYDFGGKKEVGGIAGQKKKQKRMLALVGLGGPGPRGVAKAKRVIRKEKKGGEEGLGTRRKNQSRKGVKKGSTEFSTKQRFLVVKQMCTMGRKNRTLRGNG